VSLEPGGDGDVGLAAYRASEVEKAPHLITCADAQGPQPSSIAGVRWDHVTLGFIVTEAGVVDPVSIFLKTSEARREVAMPPTGRLLRHRSGHLRAAISRERFPDIRFA
jgi:hypothetical protein